MSLFDNAINGMLKDKVSLRRRRRVIVFVAIITMLSMISTTVAWFTINTFAGVDSLDIHISLPPQLKVAMHDYGTDLSKYGKVITNEMIDEYLAQDNTRLADIILDPSTTTDGSELTTRSGARREPNKRTYLQFDAYFIATEEMWVHLTTESTEATNNDGTAVTTPETGPKADVVNCLRVGFTSEANGTAIYEPNRGTPVNGQNTFDLPSGTMVYSNNTRIFHIEQLKPTKITFKIWIEGNDPECDDDVQDADVSIQMGFAGTDNDNNPFG